MGQASAGDWTGPLPLPALPLARTGYPVVVVLDSEELRARGSTYTFDHDPDVPGPVHWPGVAADAAREADVGVRLRRRVGPDAGHGTFVAGLVRQACPEAPDPVGATVPRQRRRQRADLLRALQLLCLRQLVALRPRSRGAPLGVVTMSLGYYHEGPEDPAFDPLLRGPLTLLGKLGVAVVASAGNEPRPGPAPGRVRATTSAAGASWPGSTSAVGALSPDGTLAMFSNDGPWGAHLRAGAGLVSAVRTDLDGSLAASSSLVTAAARCDHDRT